MDDATPRPTPGRRGRHRGPSSRRPRPVRAPASPASEMKDLGRLRRSVTDRHIAGVAGGLARHLDVDPIIVRVALVVAVVLRRRRAAALRRRAGSWCPRRAPTTSRSASTSAAARSPWSASACWPSLCAVGDWAGAFWFPWPLAIVARWCVWFLNRKERSSPRARQGHGSGYDGHRRHPLARPGYATAYDPSTDTGRRTRDGLRPRRHVRRVRRPRPPRNPRKPRADPVLLHAGADRARPRAPSASSTSPARPSPTAPTRRSRSASPR